MRFKVMTYRKTQLNRLLVVHIALQAIDSTESYGMS
jgi:hypothetical protein